MSVIIEVLLHLYIMFHYNFHWKIPNFAISKRIAMKLHFPLNNLLYSLEYVTNMNVGKYVLTHKFHCFYILQILILCLMTIKMNTLPMILILF